MKMWYFHVSSLSRIYLHYTPSHSKLNVSPWTWTRDPMLPHQELSQLGYPLGITIINMLSHFLFASIHMEVTVFKALKLHVNCDCVVHLFSWVSYSIHRVVFSFFLIFYKLIKTTFTSIDFDSFLNVVRY